MVNTLERAVDPLPVSDFGQRPVARCDLLGGPDFNEQRGQVCRRYLTPQHRQALTQLRTWMTAAGMSVRLDAVGNLIGRYEGAQPGARALLIGSHIDTVPDGGLYDGALGVMLGIECVAQYSALGRRLPFALEVIAFGDEEGSRFAQSMFCSNAVAGQGDERALTTVDAAGKSLAEALTEFGLDPDRVADAARSPEQLLGYLEAHIEQGPVLEAEELAVGAVTGIASQRRFTVRFEGRAGHAGTTPMRLRKDALAAAAAAVIAVEEECRRGGPEVVGTVGRLQTSTSAFNVIVGWAEIAIDLRASTRVLRDVAFTRLERRLVDLAAERGLRMTLTPIQDLPECLCDPRWTELLGRASAELGVRPFTLLSGAGHDAMPMARITPVAMLFIRCAGGISHHSGERVDAADVAVAARTLLRFLELLADSAA